MSHVWIVDDEPAICWALKKNLESEAHHVDVYSSAEPALETLSRGPHLPDILLIDVRLPGMDGLQAMKRFREQLPSLPIIVMTAFGDLQTAVGAMRSEAFDYLTKPFDLEAALQSVRRALAQPNLKTVGADADLAEKLQKDLLLGTSPAMQATYKQIALAASTDVPVLIQGERGTGKNLVATMIHRFSRRNQDPFFPIKPLTDHNAEFEAELFGVGSPISAADSLLRTGLLELAGNGTILIEEVATVSLPVQAKILRTLESSDYFRTGEQSPRRLTARLLFSTSFDPSKLVSDGDLLQELNDHLRVFTISLPPLRERREDIAPLVQAFLADIASSKPLQISDRAMKELERRAWLGNVRELRLAMHRAALNASGTVIQLEDLPEESRHPSTSDSNAAKLKPLNEMIQQWVSERIELLKQDDKEQALSEINGDLYEDYLAMVEPPLLRSVLEACQGNRATAALVLGLHRSTLRQKMRRYGIE